MQNGGSLFSTTTCMNHFESLINQRLCFFLLLIKDSNIFMQVVVKNGVPPFCTSPCDSPCCRAHAICFGHKTAQTQSTKTGTCLLSQKLEELKSQLSKLLILISCTNHGNYSFILVFWTFLLWACPVPGKLLLVSILNVVCPHHIRVVCNYHRILGRQALEMVWVVIQAMSAPPLGPIRLRAPTSTSLCLSQSGYL